MTTVDNGWVGGWGRGGSRGGVVALLMATQLGNNGNSFGIGCQKLVLLIKVDISIAFKSRKEGLKFEHRSFSCLLYYDEK